MRPNRLILAGLALGLGGQVALAFQKAPAAPILEIPKVQGDPTKGGLDLSGAELNLGRTSGTEVRIPGLGTVGVLPKLDFGLELLYGANESKGLPQDKINSDDVQIRGTIKHRF